MLTSSFFLPTTKCDAETLRSPVLKLVSSLNQKGLCGLGSNPQELTNHWKHKGLPWDWWDQTQYHGAGCSSACPNSLASCSELHQAQQQLPSKAREQALAFTWGHTHAAFCREQSTGSKNSERLFLLRNRKGFLDPIHWEFWVLHCPSAQSTDGTLPLKGATN